MALEMATPAGFFNDCVDLNGGDDFAAANHEGIYPRDLITRSAIDLSAPLQASAVESGYQHPLGAWDLPRGLREVEFEHKHCPAYGNPFAEDDAATGHDALTNSSATTDTRSCSTRARSTSDSKRQKKSGAAVDAAAAAAPRRRKTRKNKERAGAGGEEEEEEGKRTKFLERNRIAASKCRQKKKEWVSELEDQRAGLENQHSHLQMEYSGLLGQVSGLKNELMAHAQCNDPNIDKWLQNEARRFVQGTSDIYEGVSARFGRSPTGDDSGTSARSRNGEGSASVGGFSRATNLTDDGVSTDNEFQPSLMEMEMGFRPVLSTLDPVSETDYHPSRIGGG